MKLVITIMAQYDIWFQISEYPKNEVDITVNIISIPDIHILVFINVLKMIFRIMWVNIKMKIKDVKFLWIKRNNQP